MPRGSYFCHWLIILLFISFLFSSSIFAAPIIDVVGLPNVATASARFDVVISLSNLEPVAKYKVKALGGSPASNLRRLYTLGRNGQSWLAWNGPWDSMPEVLSDASGSGRLTIGDKFYSDFEGDAVYRVRIKKDGASSYYDSQEFSLTVDPKPTPTPTPTLSPSPSPTSVPTATLVPTPTPTPSSASCQLLAARDENSNEMASVKIYVDGKYIHHYLPETLKFCSGCYCDDDRQVSCSLGRHRLRAQRAGYRDWQWENSFAAGQTYQRRPILASLITPTATLAASPVIENSSATASLVDDKATASPSGEVKGAQRSLSIPGQQRRNFALPLIFTGSGVAMISGYFIMKQKEEAVDKED